MFMSHLTLEGKRSSIIIGNGVLIMSYSTVETHSLYRSQQFNPVIIINNNASIGERAHITAINKIVIGEGTLLGKDVTITDNSHGSITFEEMKKAPSERLLVSKGPVIIGKNCWLGDKVTVCPNVTIGDYCIIGANSVVTKDMPSYCVCAGNPCKIIKYIKPNE